MVMVCPAPVLYQPRKRSRAAKEKPTSSGGMTLKVSSHDLSTLHGVALSSPPGHQQRRSTFPSMQLRSTASFSRLTPVRPKLCTLLPSHFRRR
jgi:hypothetical protein